MKEQFVSVWMEVDELVEKDIITDSWGGNGGDSGGTTDGGEGNG